MKHKGFTVVEVLIVIVVISVLATISIMSYTAVREDAADSKIRAAVKLAGDAAALRESRTGQRVAGQGGFNVANGINTLVPEYLKSDYKDGVSSKKAANAEAIFRFYNCNNGGNGYVIYASLNSPSTEDVDTFKRLRSECGHGEVQAPEAVYNYAQLF